MRQKRILIVEDDADVRRLYRTTLAMAGYAVEEAGDGVDAHAQPGKGLLAGGVDLDDLLDLGPRGGRGEHAEIVSFVGSGNSPQKLLVRADLLVSPKALDATSLQLEYLPSGDVCRGRVTQIGGTSFAGRCVLPSGASRWVDASWVPNADDTGVVGTIRLHA